MASISIFKQYIKNMITYLKKLTSMPIFRKYFDVFGTRYRSIMLRTLKVIGIQPMAHGLNTGPLERI